ncbi:MAG: DNA mismatch repair protein MutT [Dehalococcoidia bacterium]|nr:DNA mismatch repair protein MutT [Dehalococcoidia bacterium]
MTDPEPAEQAATERSAPVTRAAALIVQGDSIALIERQRQTGHYYTFPGGGLEPGETAHEAAIREVREELGLAIEVHRLVADVRYRGRAQHHFLAEVIGGEFGSGTGEEMTRPYSAEKGGFHPVWLPLADLLQEPVYPQCVAELIVRAADGGWPQHPVVLQDQGRPRIP